MTAPENPLTPAPGIGYSTEKPSENTALQGHVEFFDQDRDGVIWPWDTYSGFRDIGFGIFLSLLSMFVIHAGFSYPTWPSLLPDPFFRLDIRWMHRAKHGSDSETYTTTGKFDEERFNDIFAMYSSDGKSLRFFEGFRMLRGDRNPFDLFGQGAAIFEWLATYLFLWPEDGRMKKEDVRGVYDGSIFYKLSKSGRKPGVPEKKRYRTNGNE